MSRKQFRDTVDDSWGVNSERMSVSVIFQELILYVRLTLEVFHDVKEAVVDVRLVVKLHFDLVKVSQGILKDEAR